MDATSWTSQDDVTSVIIGVDGSIYVSVMSVNSQSPIDDHNSFLSKYNSDGSQAWTQTISSTYHYSATTDVDGSIYIATAGNENNLIKFNSDGSKERTYLFDEISGWPTARVNSVSSSSDGAIFITDRDGVTPIFTATQWKIPSSSSTMK